MAKSEFRACPEASRKGCQAVLDGEYAIPGLTFASPPIVLDIGANIGAFSMWARETWPDATIFAYEPNPETFAMFRQNTEGLDVTGRCCAVWMADGKMPLYLGVNNIGECSLFAGYEQHADKAGICRVVHARNLPPCDVLKVDTEGAERAIIEHYPHLATCKAVMLEWHSTADREWLRGHLTAAGLTCVEDREYCLNRGVQKFVRPYRPHLYVSILNGGGRSWSDNDASMEQLKQLCPARGISLSVIYDRGTGVDRSRNRQVAAAMADASMTHFMFIDNDIIFDPAWVCNMVWTGYDCVAGAYPRKDIDWERVAAAVKTGVEPDKLAGYSTSFIINHFVKDGDGFAGRKNDFGDFVEVEEIGTGFLMVRREVVEKMLLAYGADIAYVTDYEPRNTIQHMLFACQRDPACRRESAKADLLDAAVRGKGADVLYSFAVKYAAACADPSSLGRYLTEDYAFCRLWRMLGGKIYLYIDAAIEHLGTHCFSGSIRNYLKPEALSTEALEPALS